MMIFQLPAIFQFFFATTKRNDFKMYTIGIRDVGLLASTITEFILHGTTKGFDIDNLNKEITKLFPKELENQH